MSFAIPPLKPGSRAAAGSTPASLPPPSARPALPALAFSKDSSPASTGASFGANTQTPAKDSKGPAAQGTGRKRESGSPEGSGAAPGLRRTPNPATGNDVKPKPSAAANADAGKSRPQSVLKPVSRVNHDLAPGTLSFSALYAALSESSLDPSDVASMLEANMENILRVINPVETTPKGGVVFRKGAASTESFPTQSRAEAAYSAVLSEHLAVSKQDAGVLLRDYLETTLGETGESRMLSLRDANFSVVAPLASVQAFWLAEQRCAYNSLAKLYFLSGGVGSTRFMAALAPLVRDHGKVISQTITKNVMSCLKAIENPEGAEGMNESRMRGVFETFFAIVHGQGLVPRDAFFLVQALMASAKKASSMRYIARRYVKDTPCRALLDGHHVSALFCGALGSAFGALRWPGETEGDISDNFQELSRRGKCIEIPQGDVGRMDALLKDAPVDVGFAEVAILRLMWASHASGENGKDSADHVAIEHVQYAVQFECFSCIRSLMTANVDSPFVDSTICDVQRLVYWQTLDMHYAKFSPAVYPRTLEDAEGGVNLALAILRGCGQSASALVSTQVWLREYSDEKRWSATNGLLRFACALFPYRFNPLMSLLAEFCTDSDSAIEVVSTLAQRLCTRMEAVGSYEGYLRDVSNAEHERLREAAVEYGNGSSIAFFRTMDTLKFGGDSGKESSLVRPSDDLHSPYGDTLFADGCVGLKVADAPVVLWSHSWNGWSAIDLTLRSLRSLCAQPEVESLYSDSAVSELISASVLAMRLIDSICRHGNDETRNQLTESAVAVDVICDIFIAVADPPARKSSWLDVEARAGLLDASAVCLHALSQRSPGRAAAVVERVAVSPEGASALQTVVASLGLRSFPSLAAVTKVANTALAGRAIVSSEVLSSSTSRDLSAVGASRIVDFVGSIALPLWLSLYHTPSAVSKWEPGAQQWLFPAAALELFVRSSKDLLDSPVVASMVSTTLVSISSTKRGNTPLADKSHRAALYHAMILCISMLESRNAILEDALQSMVGGDDSQTREMSQTAFENMLLHPEVVHVLSVLASGTSGAVQSVEERPPSVRHALEADFSGLCTVSTSCQPVAEELFDLAARCLSLIMVCLFKHSQITGESLTQVPWPAMGHSSFGRWFGGGLTIRRGFSKRFEKSWKPFVGEFLSVVVSCGQRAASRALFGPLSMSAKSEDVEDKSSSSSAEHEMLSAVVVRLKSALAEWVKMSDSQLPVVTGETQKLSLGDVASCISACVRVLRTSWDVHGGVWLKDAWSSLKVWKLLSGLLRCSGSTNATGVDLVHVFASGADSKDMLYPQSLTLSDEEIRAGGRERDLQSVWRFTVADVLGMLTSEVVFRCNDLAKVPGTSPDMSATDTAEQGLREEVFDDAAFVALRDSFTERWMHVFLDMHHTKVISSNVLANRTVDVGRSSVENFAQHVANQLSAVIGNGGIPLRRQRGAVSTAYGGAYVYSVEHAEQALLEAGVDPGTRRFLLSQLVLLNLRLSRLDAHLRLSQAFSALTTMIVMADSVSPSPSKMLTYSSPQYCGKLCRVLSQALYNCTSVLCESRSVSFIHLEYCRLLGFVSARLSPEEFEQAALSSVRFDTPGLADDSNGSMSPVAKLAELVSRRRELLRRERPGSDVYSFHMSILCWLLLSASKLAVGSAFRSEKDLSSLADVSIDVLEAGKPSPKVCSAVSVALAGVVLTSSSLLQPVLGRKDASSTVFAAIAELSRSASLGDGDENTLAAAHLVMFISKMASGVAGLGSTILLNASALEHLSTGSVAALLPPSDVVIPAYNVESLAREPVHRLWCASLALAAGLISNVEPRIDATAPVSAHVRGILEFASSMTARLSRVNLDSQGDWPPSVSSDDTEASGRFRHSRHLTMARVEEAELVMQVVFALTSHALDLRDSVPHVLHSMLEVTTRLVYQTFRLIRAEPVERWVRPVSEQERDQSELTRSGSDTSGSGLHTVAGSSPWSTSPIMSPGHAGTPGGPGTPSSPRRSSQQALRAAIGRLSSRGGGSSVPPSPGMPVTPQHQSPMSVGTVSRPVSSGGKYQSPLSPWGTSKAGLITGGGVSFGDEVTLSMLRTLGAALGALRRLSSVMQGPIFSATMQISEDAPSIGLLVGIQFHACTELQRGCEGARRDALMVMLEGALVLSLSHAAHHSRHGQLSEGVRDEMHRRIETVVSRMRRLVPPCPSYSVVHSDVDSFLRHFKAA